MQAEMLGYRDTIEEYKRKVEGSQHEVSQWKEGNLIIQYIMQIHKDELDIIGPSIGKPVITPTMYEMVEILGIRCSMQEQKLSAMSSLLEHEASILTLFKELAEWLIRARAVVGEENDSDTPVPQDIQRSPKYILLAVYMLEVKIQGHRDVVDRLENLLFHD